MKIKTQLFAVITVVLFLMSIGNGQTCDSSSVSEVLPGDEVWLISAREVDACHCSCASELKIQKLCGGVWFESSLQELKNSNGAKQNLVYVHGYQTDFLHAQVGGFGVYQNLFTNCRQTGPVRFIIWAWKSEKETRRPIMDFNIKSQRAIELGNVFALTLNELGNGETTIVGYSLGAQVVVSALAHSGCYLGPPVRIAIIAAANDCGFASCCNQLNGCGNVRKSVIFFNEKDRAIRAANLICRTKYGSNYQPFQELALQNSNALGQVCIVDISKEASRKHAIARYSALPVVQSFVQQLMVENEGLEIASNDSD